MKKRRPTSAQYAQTESLAVRTGEHCPETGWWHPMHSGKPEAAASSRFVGEGSVMPALAGAPAFWVPRRS